MCVQNRCALCTMYIMQRTHCIYMRNKPLRRARQETSVNVVNNVDVSMPTIVIFKHYLLNILSSDY